MQNKIPLYHRCGGFFILVILCFVPLYAQADQNTAGQSQSTSQIDQDSLTRWNGLTDDQKRVLRYREYLFKNMDPALKQKVLERWRRFRALSPKIQQEIRENWRKYQSLSPQERRKLQKNLEIWKHMTPQQREKFEANRRVWENITPEEKDKARENHN